jgi:uncharacterized membrane protein YdbT with pleckstrin-like domain
MRRKPCTRSNCLGWSAGQHCELLGHDEICVSLASPPLCNAWLGQRKIALMSYVQRVLQPGEKVRQVSSLHWIGYWPGVAALLLALITYSLSGTRLLPGIWRYAAYAFALVAVVLLIQQWLRWWVTEIAVTDRRVIYKKGLIRRRTNEMNMDKVESVQIDQSILGRILDYGDVTILGTGEGFETLRTIAGPIELRNSITGTAHHA